MVAGTRQVVVESGDPLEVVSNKVKELWPLTAGDQRAADSLGFGMSANGGVGDPVADGQLLMPAEVPMPTHLIPWQETPDDRRR